MVKISKYPKIETLFKRDEQFNLTNEIRCPEFENINRWLITEKINGTNIRVEFDKDGISIKGRTETSQIPLFLLETISNMFHIEKFVKVFDGAKEVCLFGEGYGAKIQKGGGNYNKGNSFRLITVWIDGWWLEWESIQEVARELGIKTVPSLGVMSLNQAIDYVTGVNFASVVAEEETGKYILAEGIVARSYPLMLFRNRLPIQWKLKISDYKKKGVI